MTLAGINRYLDRYAEAIANEMRTHLPMTLGQTYQYVLVIPLFDEAHKCLDATLPEGISDTLVIVVVNAAVDADPAAILRTQAFLAPFNPHPQHPFAAIHRPFGNTVLLIDCCTTPRLFPPKQGVGLARKIGGDIALACIADQIVDSPWIHCTDGDVKLPDNYFDTPDLKPDVAVAIYPFCHQPIHNDILQYEISLRYYVTALAQAGSPYAFQTIGSLLKINANHYAMVRGFPRRLAAEDFYMLNKLAKTGKVMRLQHPDIILSSRVSKRVPFGTGAAMARLSNHEEMLLYHPQVFRELQSWLGLSQKLWDELHDDWSNQSDAKTHLQAWWQHQELSDTLWVTLLDLKVDQALGQAFQQCRDFPHFQFFLKVWFDAFRTLKFVHYQRDHYWPSLPIKEAIALFWNSNYQNQSKNTDQPSRASKLDHFHPSPDFLDILQQLQWQESQLPVAIGPTLSLK